MRATRTYTSSVWTICSAAVQGSMRRCATSSAGSVTRVARSRFARSASSVLTISVELRPRASRRTCRSLGPGPRAGPVRLDRRGELGRRHCPLMCRASRPSARPRPRAYGRRAARASAELALGAIRAFAIGLVDREHVGDLEEARLDRLDVVAEPGHRDDDRRVRARHHVDLVLTDADGLDQNPLEAHRVEHVRDLERRAREPAEVTARREAADEHARVERVALHPHAIAE